MYVARLAVAVSALGLCAGAAAQNYPTKPVRIVVNFAPGGGTDIVARALAAEFTRTLGQQFIVENRAGGNGNIGADVVAKAPPDGHTVLVATNAAIVINPHLYKKLSYDPLKDLAPVSQIATLPFVLVTHPTVPAKSLRDLIALAKATPKGLTYGSSGTGGGAHLAGEMLKNMAHMNIVHVPYKGSAPALTGILSGEVDFMFVSILTVTPLIKDRRMRAIAVSSPKRNPALPDVPALSELPQLKTAESDLWYGMLAPARTDPRVIDVLQRETARVVALPDFKNKFEPSGTILVGNTPDAFGKVIRSDYERWGAVIKAAGTTAD
ncbi:MAG TPA: tripartite tricarboxylate transporter substrate binding protein [Burkholderiales bacterium]|nr:tripartite tricarboxylate transporter substrate binding protein [Burkholderiales bacterium]